MKRLLLFILVLVTGCKQDTSIQIPEIPNVPFVWCYYVEGAKQTFAQAIATDDFYGDRPIPKIDNSVLADTQFEISIKKNDSSLGLFKHSIYRDTFFRIINNIGSEPDTIYHYDSPINYNYLADTESTSPDKADDIFELHVKHPDFADMYARQEMPTKVPLEKVELVNIELGPSGFYRANLQITLNDPANMDNYYELTGLILSLDDTGALTTNDITLRPFNIGADDPIVIDYEPTPNFSSIYFSDNTFNGKKRVLSFWIEMDDPFLSDNFRLIWRCISPEWYRFFEARRSAAENSILNDNLGNNLTQPYSLPFNIEGEDGFGVFGVGTEEVYKVE